MQQADYPSGRLRFGIFEADLRTGQLMKHGRRLRLQEQPFHLLAILLQRPGVLVTREELRAALWPQTTVDFDHGLNKAISKIREALGDSAENPRFIETVARRGYRFLADVVDVQDIGPKTTAAALAGDEQPERAAGDLALLGDAGIPRAIDASAVPGWLPGASTARFLGLGVTLILAAGGAWLLYPWRHAEATISSLAVLPLANLSGDASQDYLADGMTEELITDLGQISALRVISRTSVMTYKGVRKALPEIARELDVRAVVEGSVLRSGGQIRITAQLIQEPEDWHMWAQVYTEDLSDTLALQSRVARDIAQHVRAALSGQEQAALDRPKAVNPQAFEDYLKGRFFWNKRTGDGLKIAITYFSRAILGDRSFAKAYSGLADSYALAGDWEYGVLSPQEASAKAKAAAAKALALDDSLAEAHTSLAFALDLYDWNWEAAGKEYMRAIELNPGYATAHLWYAWHLIVLGQFTDGIAELRKAESLDPLSLIIGADLADALCIAHRYDEFDRAK